MNVLQWRDCLCLRQSRCGPWHYFAIAHRLAAFLDVDATRKSFVNTFAEIQRSGSTKPIAAASASAVCSRQTAPGMARSRSGIVLDSDFVAPSL